MAPFGPDAHFARVSDQPAIPGFHTNLVAFGVIWGYLHVNGAIFHTNLGYLHVNAYVFHTRRLAKRLANLG